MTIFIILGCLFTATVGLFCGALLTGGIPEKCGVGRILVILLIAHIIGFGAASLMAYENQTKEKAWNNGTCPECGEEWVFTCADHIKNRGTDYYYTCPKCGKITVQTYIR